MKRILTISAVMAALIISCFTSAGQTVKKDFDLKGFTGIELGNEFRATVQKSDSYKVSVEVSEDLVPFLDVRVSKGDLIIELRNVPTRLTLLKSNAMIAIISMPDLRSVTLNGSSKITVADSFEALRQPHRLNRLVVSKRLLVNDKRPGAQQSGLACRNVVTAG